jgi:hypothetical protein
VLTRVRAAGPVTVKSRSARDMASSRLTDPFLQLGVQPIQTVQAAEPIAIGNVRPALAFRRYTAAVGAPVHRP